MAEFFPSRSDVRDRIVAEHGLRPIGRTDLLGESHHHADFHFAFGATRTPRPAFVSTVEVEQAGFGDVTDTEESFVHRIHVLQERRVLPPRSA